MSNYWAVDRYLAIKNRFYLITRSGNITAMNLTLRSALEQSDDNHFIRQHQGKPSTAAVRRRQYLKDRGVDGGRSRRTRYKKKSKISKNKNRSSFWAYSDDDRSGAGWFKESKTKRGFNKGKKRTSRR